MNQPPLNPDAFDAAWEALYEEFSGRIGDLNGNDCERMAETAIRAYLAAALPEVTSVEELDALPVGSIIADLYDERGNAPVVLCKALNRDWAALTTGTQNGRPWWTSEEIAQVARRLRVLHRPEVKP